MVPGKSKYNYARGFEKLLNEGQNHFLKHETTTVPPEATQTAHHG